MNDREYASLVCYTTPQSVCAVAVTSVKETTRNRFIHVLLCADGTRTLKRVICITNFFVQE